MWSKTHTIRLFPNALQEKQLRNLMHLRNVIWNKLLRIREKEYRKTKKSMSDFDLMSFLPALKQKQPELVNYNSKAAQVIARQIGNAYRCFFKRLKNGDYTAKLPGTIDENKIVSLTFNQSGWSFKNGKMTLSKVDKSIPFKSKDDLSNLKVKEIRIKLRNDKWLCDVIAEYDDQHQTNNSNNVLAIDLGLSKLATGIDNTGKVLVLPNKAKKISQHFVKQISKVDQKISSKQEGSRRYKKLRQVRKDLFKRKNAQVKQALHIQSKQVANMNYHTVILGDLSVKELMSKEGNKKKGVRKSFHQSAIDTFRSFLTYKCAGNTNVVEIDERHTTQTNCLTGNKFKQKVELKDRTVQISDTIIIDRDLNSAINILKRWESFHLAALTPPLSEITLLNVLEKNNFFSRELTIL
jgi:putative transposase